MKFPRIVWAGGFSKKAVMTHTQVNSKEQYLRFIRLNNNRMITEISKMDWVSPNQRYLTKYFLT